MERAMTSGPFDPRTSAQDHISIIVDAITKYITTLARTDPTSNFDYVENARMVIKEIERLRKLVPSLKWIPNAIAIFNGPANKQYTPQSLSKVLELFHAVRSTDFINDESYFSAPIFNFDRLFKNYYDRDNFDQLFVDITVAFESLLNWPDAKTRLSPKNIRDIRALLEILRSRSNPSIGAVQSFFIAIRSFLAAISSEAAIIIAGVDIIQSILSLITEGEHKLDGITEEIQEQFCNEFNNETFVQTFRKENPLLCYSKDGSLKRAIELSTTDTRA